MELKLVFLMDLVRLIDSSKCATKQIIIIIIIIYGISLVHKLKEVSDTNKGNTPEVEKQVQKKKI